MQSSTVQTTRLKVHVVTAGEAGRTPVVFLHGNLSSWGFFRPILDAMPPQYFCVAPDLRGFGGTEPIPIDATRGLRDFSDDLWSLLQAMKLDKEPVHFVGWSTGGAILEQYAIDHAAHVASLTLVAPLSPYGFLGTKDAKGTPCAPDYAGSGGGTAAPDYMARIKAGDAGAASPFSPRNVMNGFFFAPPFRVPIELEDFLVAEILKTQIAEGFNPGTALRSQSWPGMVPGNIGVLNAMSPKFVNLSAFAAIDPKPTVLWVRGAEDKVISDASPLDWAVLGASGMVPGWPGAEEFPPQPMLQQTRALLRAYTKNGGTYQEAVIPGAGHAVFLEKQEAFLKVLLGFLRTGMAPLVPDASP